MNSHKTTTEMKTKARGLLLGKYRPYIGAVLIVDSIILLISALASSVLPSDNVWGNVLNIAISFVLELLSSVFMLGLIHFTMNICLNRSYKISDIFYGFSSHPDKAIICKFLFLAAELICLLPAGIFFLLYYITETTWLTILVALLLVIGMIASVIIHLSFYFVYYLILDYPDASIKELIIYCANKMQGQRIKLFYLYASFLPLYVLGFLSLGIGIFFVTPYVNVSIAQFYLDVFHNDDEVLIENDTDFNDSTETNPINTL